MFKYRYHCKRCGFSIDCDTKAQFKGVKKIHKNGCIWVDAGLSKPIYVRPELRECIEELLEKKEK